jgi:hypothetical protein
VTANRTGAEMALPVAYEAISPAEKPRTRSMMRMRAMAIAFGVAMVACVALLAAGHRSSRRSELVALSPEAHVGG